MLTFRIATSERCGARSTGGRRIWQRFGAPMRDGPSDARRRGKREKTVSISDEKLEGSFTKALRELVAQRDEAIRLGDERLAVLWDEKKAEIAKLTEERDEARFDNRQLREWLDRLLAHDATSRVQEAQRERDEARAEVDRLTKRLSAAGEAWLETMPKERADQLGRWSRCCSDCDTKLPPEWWLFFEPAKERS